MGGVLFVVGSKREMQISLLEWNLKSGFALSARYFSLLRQRKVPKRKAVPEACPLRGFPALLAISGARRTRRICRACGLQIQLKQGGSHNPEIAAMLGCACGVWYGSPEPIALAECCWIPAFAGKTWKSSRSGERSYNKASGVGCPSGAAEHRRENRIKLAPCLSVIERSEIASCASASFP
jgi:hypothetical protein